MVTIILLLHRSKVMLLLGGKGVICGEVGSVGKKGEFWTDPLVSNLGGRFSRGDDRSACSGRPVFVRLYQRGRLLLVGLSLRGIKWSGEELAVSGGDGSGASGGDRAGCNGHTTSCCRWKTLRRGGGCHFGWRGRSLGRGRGNDRGDGRRLLVGGDLWDGGERGGGRGGRLGGGGGGRRRLASTGQELGHLQRLQFLQFHHQLLHMGQQLVVLLEKLLHSRLGRNGEYCSKSQWARLT